MKVAAKQDKYIFSNRIESDPLPFHSAAHQPARQRHPSPFCIHHSATYQFIIFCMRLLPLYTVSAFHSIY